MAKKVTLNGKKDGKNWKRSWLKEKKGKRLGKEGASKWNTQAIYSEEDSWLVGMQQWPQENIIHIRITGANDRNKSMEKGKGISGM